MATRDRGWPDKGRLYKRDRDGRDVPRDRWEYVRGTYWIEYYVDGTRRRESLGETRIGPAVKEWRARVAPLVVEGELLRRKAVAWAVEAAEQELEAARPRTPVRKVWQTYPYTHTVHGRTERPLAESTQLDYLAQWEKFVEWIMARKGERVALEDVTVEDARAFRDEISGKLSARRVNVIVRTCRVMWLRAGVAPDPFAGLKPRAEVSRGRRDLTEAELRKVCGAATGELRVLFAVGLYTGLRLGAAVTLEWGQVDLGAAMLRFAPQVRTTKNVPEVVPLHGVLAAILNETPATEREGDVMPQLAAMYRDDPTRVSYRVQAHFGDCGIRTLPEKKADGRARRACEVGFHSLRHTFVTLAARGAPLHVVQALAGHGPEVQRRYLHVHQEDVRAAVAALPAVAGPAAPVETPVQRAVALLEAGLEKGVRAKQLRHAAREALELLQQRVHESR